MSSSGGRYAYSGQSGLNNRAGQSIGNSAGSRINPRRQHYHGFDDDTEIPLETLVEGGRLSAKASNWRRGADESGSGNSRNRDWSNDNESEKAIVETKTTEITFSERHV